MKFTKKELIAIGVFVVGTALGWYFAGYWGLGFIGGPLAVGAFLYIWLNRKDLIDGIITGLVNLLGMNKAQFKGMKRFGWTSGGAEVNAPISIPDNVLKNLDIGVQNGIRRVLQAHPTWKNKANVSDYAFVFVNPMGVSSDLPGAPTITVNNFGQPTQIAAGATMGFEANHGPKRPYIVLPHQAGSGWNYMKYLVTTVAHEVVHYMEAFNDPTEFAKHITTHEGFDIEYPPAPGEQAAI